MGYEEGGDRNFIFHSGTGKPITIKRHPSSGKTSVRGTTSVMHHFMVSTIQMQRICWVREHPSRSFNIDRNIPLHISGDFR